jgi:hypothetical protein
MQGLIERKPHIGEVIERVALQRISSEGIGKNGDLASKELRLDEDRDDGA